MEETEKKKETKNKEESASRKLLGGSDFDKLAEELATIAPIIAKSGSYDLFSSRAYLFSIGDGCGLSSYLRIFADLIASLGLKGVNKINVIEQQLGPFASGAGAFENVFRVIYNGGANGVNVFCIDISEWLDKTESEFFKQFLSIVEKLCDQYVFVFRVPYIDKDLLRRIEYSIGDLLNIRTVVFPPLSKREIESFAKLAFKNYGLELDERASEMFFVRLFKERNDGRSYGMNTVNKVIKEIAYKKLLLGGNPIVSADEMAIICEVGKYFLSGEEELALLTLNDDLRRKILDTAAELERRLKAGKKEPVNLRFIGNPGTGKTTVARIIGKLLKERGALKAGALYEYEGKNLLGEYVGETAPIISAICRDAVGSVLFIDNPQDFFKSDFGREALTALCNQMRNYAQSVVIMAGYAEDFDDMKGLFPEIAALMPIEIEFPCFTKSELLSIFVNEAKQEYVCEEELFDAAREYFMSLPDELITRKDFSNVRFVRNLLSRTAAKAEMRVELYGGDGKLTKEDFECASKEKDISFDIPKKARMGFCF